MKLVHRVILPATIIMALSFGSAVYGCKDTDTLHDKSIVNVVKVVKTAVPIDDNQKKDKLNSAKKMARKNLKDNLDEKVRKGEISQETADKTLLEFDDNIKSAPVQGFKTQVETVNKKSLNFRREFKDELYNQAKNGKITVERAEEIYDSFVDMTV